MSSEISNLIEWYQAAMQYGRQQHGDEDSWPEIKMGSDQHKAWIMYFRDNGLPLPATLSNIHMNKTQAWTAPCEWPHDLKIAVKVRSVIPTGLSFSAQVRQCHQALRALAVNINDKNARFALIRHSVDVRKRAMELFRPGEAKPALVTMEYRDAKGRLHTTGEPYFLPKWDSDTPPGGPGGVIKWSEERNSYAGPECRSEPQGKSPIDYSEEVAL